MWLLGAILFWWSGIICLSTQANFHDPDSRFCLLAKHRSVWHKYRKSKAICFFSLVPSAGIFRYTNSIPCGHFVSPPPGGSQNGLARSSIPDACLPETCSECTEKSDLCRSFLNPVPSAGIEPTLQAPQACVLSIERRGQAMSETVAGI